MVISSVGYLFCLFVFYTAWLYLGRRTRKEFWSAVLSLPKLSILITGTFLHENCFLEGRCSRSSQVQNGWESFISVLSATMWKSEEWRIISSFCAQTSSLQVSHIFCKLLPLYLKWSMKAEVHKSSKFNKIIFNEWIFKRMQIIWFFFTWRALELYSYELVSVSQNCNMKMKW